MTKDDENSSGMAALEHGRNCWGSIAAFSERRAEEAWALLDWSPFWGKGEWDVDQEKTVGFLICGIIRKCGKET